MHAHTGRKGWAAMAMMWVLAWMGVVVCAHSAASPLPLHSASASAFAAPSSYIAAAVQMSPSGSALTPPHQTIQDTIERFEPFVRAAKEKGAQVIVFPEGVLGMFNAQLKNTRDAALPYCVEIGDLPAPAHSSSPAPNPCVELAHDPPSVNSTSYQPYVTSCLARKYGLLLSFNTCEVRRCRVGEEGGCPTDGRWQWNTQLVFDETGTLVLKYHKVHLFGEGAIFDQGDSLSTGRGVQQSASFLSRFGVRFGVVTCFDLLFSEPTARLAVEEGVTDFLFSSWWVNQSPSFNALLSQQAFSRLYHVNLIASNIGRSQSAAGGGIYSRGEAMVTLFDAKAGITPINQLLMAKLPILTREPKQQTSEAKEAKLAEELIDSGSPRRAVATMAAHGKHSIDNNHLPLPLSSLSYQPCQPNIVFLDQANCTLFTPALLRKHAEGMGHALPTPSSHSSLSYSIPVVHHGVSCLLSFSLSSSSPVSEEETFVAFAYEGVQVFQHTPDPLALQVCAMHRCIPQAGKELLSCLGAFRAPLTRFDSFSVQATGFADQTAPFPMLSVEDGQVLADASLTQLTDSHTPHTATEDAHLRGGDRVVTWSSTPQFRNQSVASALLYGQWWK